nr:hypothetical protein Q903MT_gene2139 [Picea sitchensis]
MLTEPYPVRSQNLYLFFSSGTLHSMPHFSSCCAPYHPQINPFFCCHLLYLKESPYMLEISDFA